MAKKRRMSTIRFRRGQPEHNLLAAATHFVRARGGSAVVVGGIEVQDLLGGKFKVAVGVLGRKPVKKSTRKKKR